MDRTWNVIIPHHGFRPLRYHKNMHVTCLRECQFFNKKDARVKDKSSGQSYRAL
jgi:hypothetical protein